MASWEAAGGAPGGWVEVLSPRLNYVFRGLAYTLQPRPVLIEMRYTIYVALLDDQQL